MRFASGFTLIEILTVIAAIVALLSVVMFSLGSVGLRKASSLAKETSFLMRTLADEAILTGHRHGLYVNKQRRSISAMTGGRNQQWSGESSGFEPIVWGADMQVRLENSDLSGDYQGANFNAPDEDPGDKKPGGPAIIFEPIGTWNSRANSLVFIYEGQPVKRLTWTAIGHLEIKDIVEQEWG